MRGRLLAIASVVSLPLCIVMLALCFTSALHPMRWSQTLDYYASRNDHADFEIHHCIGLSNGVLYVQAVRRGNAVPGLPVKVYAGYPAAYPPAETVMGFNLTRTQTAGWSFREADFPLRPIAAISAIIPMRSYLRRRRAKRAGLCRACNYNLTGNLSGVCPECGTAIPPVS